jgi:UDP-N-acetylmuramyl pentapeptide phosphotransferase/UDP-N-acetylglucosamine-1-phosphate transferase
MIYKYNLLICSIIIGVILNILFQWLFVKLKKFDSINARSSHSTLATKTGGIAVFTTLFFITLYFYFTSNEIFDFSLLIPLAIIFVIGVYDDFYDADFKLKFFIQIIVAKLLIDNGFIINNYYGLFGIYEIPYLLAQFTSVFVFLVLVNAFNFIDGIDGLAVSFAIFSILGFEYLNESSLLTLLNTICIGGLIPLYYFNFKKENKIFLGDAGSLFLGSLIAINLFHYLDIDQRVLNGNRVLLSVAVLFYPLIDLLRVFIIRINQKKSPFVADKNHIHHIIQDKVKNHFLTSSIILMSSLMILIMSYIILNKF